MQVFVLHLCTKFEVRRPSHSDNIAHLLCIIVLVALGSIQLICNISFISDTFLCPISYVCTFRHIHSFIHSFINTHKAAENKKHNKNST